VRIGLLADHPELIETLARWHCDEWGRPDDPKSRAFWESALRREAGRDEIPIVFIALDGDALVGSVSLVEHNMNTHRELSPWLAGTFVHAPRRAEGIGTALVRHAVRRAVELGVRRLYLYTESARGFYDKLGWQPFSEELYEGATVTVMTIDVI
jgi:GNAT superfamily N-acetyltransferase